MFLKKWVAAVSVLFLLSDIAGAAPQYAYRIRFTDKKGAASLLNPLAFLSQRALDRRSMQGIAVDSTDQPISPLYLDTVLNLSQGVLHVTSRWLNSCTILTNDSANIQVLKTKPWISSITWVGYYPGGLHTVTGAGRTSSSPIPGSPKLKTTGNPAWYGPAWTQTDVVNGDCLHDKGWKGQGKLIAVLDDGFHYVNSAPAFDSAFSSGRIVDTRNFVQGHSDVYTDFLLHGTQVLSTIAGYLPNTYVGAAPLAQFALYATEDPSGEKPIEMDNMVSAFERADSIGADVVSSSLGYNSFDAPFPSIPPSQLDGKTTIAAIGVNMAAQKGMLMVITAGNEGSGGLLTPGDADSALTIGNVDANGNPAFNSGHGPNAAGHVKPEVCAVGSPGFVLTSGVTPFTVFGTSISTPQVAGFAACLWQGSTGKTNAEIKAGIIRSASFFPVAQSVQLGYGVPDFCEADIILGIDAVDQGGDRVKLYPNPFSGSVSIEVTTAGNQPLEISITDITGKLVYHHITTTAAGSNTIRIQLPASLATGTYLCRILLEDRVSVTRLIKQ